jgi:peptide/nickel transport system substrate-binding protein
LDLIRNVLQEIRMSKLPKFSIGISVWAPGLLALLTILIVACGTSASPTPAATQPTPTAVAQPTPLAISSTPTPVSSQNTTKPKPTAAPDKVVSARDSLTFVTSEEPTTLGAASENCGGNIQNTICDDMASDPLTWIDDQNGFQVVGLTGIEGWEQLEPDRWRFKLRDGVKFHNGAPWNAEQAKFWIDWFGDKETSGHYNSNDFSFHGVISGEVVDDLTLDVVCGGPCPVLPRTTIFTKFQDVGWFEQASEEEVESMTVGLGPYKIIEWRRGQDVTLEAFEDYKPNPSTNFARAPIIKNITQVWRNEAFVRASMIATGEADWAEVTLDDREMVPNWKSHPNNETYIYVFDTMYHPELRKRDVREALSLAIDCDTLMETLYDGLFQCWTALSATGTVGINAANSAGYPYDPGRARELLEKADYDPENTITLSIRSSRVPKDVEYGEAVVTFWREVGINAELQVVDSAVRNDIYRSTCFHKRTRDEVLNAPGEDLHDKCVSLGPAAPRFTSPNVTESATSNESLDFQRHAQQRLSCWSRSSGVCFSDLEAMIEEAVTTPTGDLRRERLEAVAQRARDDFYLHVNFQVVQIYALSDGLEWEPHYAPRIRANTMYFTQ